MAPVQCASECQEQLERDGARVKIMTDHLVNVQQAKCQRWMRECDSSLNLMLKASDDVPQSWPCKFLPFWHAGMLSNSHHESSPFRNWWILSSWWTPRRMKLPQRSICRSKYASLSTNHCNLLISLILFVSLTISTSWSWGPYQSEAWLQVRSTNLENSHSPGWALTRKHPAGHRRPENLGEEIFLKTPGLFGVFFFGRGNWDDWNLRSWDCRRFWKTPRTIWDCPKIIKTHSQTERPQVLKTLTAKKSLALELLRLKKKIIVPRAKWF